MGRNFGQNRLKLAVSFFFRSILRQSLYSEFNYLAKCLLSKDICNRTCLGLSLKKQRMNTRRIERIRWLESSSGKMPKRPKPFENKGKYKTRRPGETGCFFQIGGGGGNRTRVRRFKTKGIYMLSLFFRIRSQKAKNKQNLLSTVLLRVSML